MAALDLQEQEQVDALKAWWKDNAKWVAGGLTLALAIYAGVWGWKYWHAQQNSEAAALYMDVLKQMGSNDPKRVNDVAAAMVSKYGSTFYAGRAQLLAAQYNMQAKDSAAAAGQLQWVIDFASDDGMKQVARLQLASLLLDGKKYDEAIKLLDAPHPDAYTGLYSDLRGDVMSAQGKKQEAIAAYKQALEQLDAKSMYRTLVQMKLDALGVVK